MKQVIDTTLNVLNSIYLTWVILAVPAFPFIQELVWPGRYYPELMWETGVLSTQLVVVALAISPLLAIFRQIGYITKILLWLQKRRRAIGVAAFVYGAFHTLYYVRYTGSLELIILEMEDLDLAIGWIAFVGMLMLAITSNRISVRLLGKHWKPFQRTVYLTAILVGLHWFLIGNFLPDFWMLAIVIIAIQALRLLIQFWKKPGIIG